MVIGNNVWLNRLATLLLLLTVVGCTTLSRGNAVPPEQYANSSIQGMPDVRYKIYSQAGIDKMLSDIRKGMNDPGFVRNASTTNFLALSGGGDNGAFGAGLLSGWTARGDRPVFSLVSGVSTGAMIAPFAYLGSDYDYVLRRVFTQVDQQDIFVTQGLFGILFGDAYADTTPLYGLIQTYVTPELMEKIAYEYKHNNRWLLVATTNLDAGVPVVWNMGELASVGTPESLKLFRKVLLASAAIPGAFPPVMIDVMVGDTQYQEMHVDGGASTEVFIYPSALGAAAIKQGVMSPDQTRNAYIIRNSRLDAQWRQIERNTLTIMGRAVDQLIQAQGFGDLYRNYLITKRDKMDFNLAYIGSDFNAPHASDFDRKYMDSLYKYGYDLALAGYPWAKLPPGYDIATDTSVANQVQIQQQLLKKYRRSTKNVNQKR